MVEQHSLGHDMETKSRAKPILWAREMQKRALGVYAVQRHGLAADSLSVGIARARDEGRAVERHRAW